jgi:uncharacterized ferritin-like protein (DUF455 family)
VQDPDVPGPPTTLREHCLSVLEQGDLEAKLRPPRGPGGAPLTDDLGGPPLLVERPARSPEIAMSPGGEKLPKLRELVDAGARAACLERFAHHELQAVELFAWALLAYPELPAAARRGLVGALADEQRHCRLYLERLAAHGARFGEGPLSDYFWRHVPALRASPHGARAFFCAMGLTLEQANLDFTLLYRDAFREAGDEETALVLELVHREEVGHVRLAAEWLALLDAEAGSQLEAYERAVPFPFSAARAKGRRFDAASRRRAGLEEELIEHVRRARPYGKLGE